MDLTIQITQYNKLYNWLMIKQTLTAYIIVCVYPEIVNVFCLCVNDKNMIKELEKEEEQEKL